MTNEASAPHPLPDHLVRKLVAAERLLRAGQFAQAATLAEEVTGQAPDAASAWHLAAVALAQDGRHEAACERFQRALKLTPDDAHLLANFATALRRLDRTDEATALWRRAVDLAPAFGQAWLDLGLTELDLGHLAAARDALQHATTLMPNTATAWHGLASVLDGEGRPTDAEKALRRALACAPGQPALLVHLGNVLRRQARLDEALACYTQVRHVGTESPELLDAEAGTLLDAGRVDEAIAMARRMATTYPRFVPGQRTLANIRWQYGDHAESAADPFESLAQAVGAYPDDHELRFAYASLLHQAGQGDAALEQVAELRRRDDQPAFRRFQADTLEALGRSGEAAGLYDELYRRLSWRAPDFLNSYTRHLLKTGQWQAAATRAEEAIAQDAWNQEALANLSTAWRLLGDAREYWLCDYDRFVTLENIDVPDGYADVGQFLDELKTLLLGLHQATRAPVRQSLRRGTQTAGNLFGRLEPPIRAIEHAFLATAGRWARGLPYEDRHPFLGRKASAVRGKGAWSVKLVSTGFHVNHVHPLGWISSAFYVSLPPVMQGAGDDAGAIQFGQPPTELGLDLPPRRVVHPRPGALALFPSYMWHGTVPFQDDAFRMTVACDMIPVG